MRRNPLRKRAPCTYYFTGHALVDATQAALAALVYVEPTPTPQVHAIEPMFHVVSKGLADKMHGGRVNATGKLYGIFSTEDAAEGFMSREVPDGFGGTKPVYPGAQLYMRIVHQ